LSIHDFTVQVIDQQVALLAVVSDRAPYPGDIGFDIRRVGISGCKHDQFGFQGDADGYVRIRAIDRSQDRPDLVLVSHLDDLVAGRAPEPVVIGDHQIEGDLSLEITAAGIRLLDGKAGSLEHFDSELFLVALSAGCDGDRGHDGTDEPDLHRLNLLRFRDGSSGPGIFHLFQEVLLERYDPAEGLHVLRGGGVVVVLPDAQVWDFVGVHCVDDSNGPNAGYLRASAFFHHTPMPRS